MAHIEDLGSIYKTTKQECACSEINLGILLHIAGYHL